MLVKNPDAASASTDAVDVARETQPELSKLHVSKATGSMPRGPKKRKAPHRRKRQHGPGHADHDDTAPKKTFDAGAGFDDPATQRLWDEIPETRT